MNKKIVKLNQIPKYVRPQTATLVGGSFDLFHVGHLRYLQEASKVGRPLIVIVQTDKMVRIRKGFSRPIVNQNHRADIIAGLECVDYVLVLDKPSHYDGYLEIIQPKNLVFFTENMNYRKRRAIEVQKKFPTIKVRFVSPGKKQASTSRTVKKIMSNHKRPKTGNTIADLLYELAEKSTSNVGKISAVIVKNGKVVEKGINTSHEKHAEHQAIAQLRKKHSLEGCELYVLIPPCIQCAEHILKSPIKQVYYLHSYGNDDGIRLLRMNGVSVKPIKI